MKLTGEKIVGVVGSSDKADVAPVSIIHYLYSLISTVIWAVQDLAPVLYQMI